MKNSSLSLQVLLCVVILGATAVVPFEGVAQEAGTVLTSGFNGPMGILAAADGSILVIDTGVGGDTEFEFPHFETGVLTTVSFGETARVIRVAKDGSQTVLAALPSMILGPGESAGGARLTMIDGVLYATSGMWMAGGGDEPRTNMASIVRIEDGEAVEIASTYTIERKLNPDSLIVESNPYGIVAGPDGYLWVADAGGNSLLKVDPGTGATELVASFGAVPSPLPNPNRGGRMEADPVPTGLAFDAGGNLFVALLPGFPFIPGSARVVRVNPDGEVSDYATGLTMLVDLRLGPDGELYAVSLGRFTEEGPQPNSGAIVRIAEGDQSEEVLTGLSFPTSIDFNDNGEAFVTINGVGAPGTGEVVVFPKF
ncbi:MAG: ScyD/ScyE family protein [Rhodothermales bacterium]|nr:ScyD/ScyE family protein [Rhodothermales bacterium]